MVNDISIIAGIVFLFVSIGFLTPFINEEFRGDIPENNPDSVVEGISAEDGSSSVSAFNVLGSIFSMFFWTFGNIPTWLDTIFVVIRIILALTIVRNIWIGGGG